MPAVGRSSALLVLALCATLAGGATATAEHPVVAAAAVTGRVADADLQAAADRRVLFGHQSVGWNIIGGVEDLYSRSGVDAPDVRHVEAHVPSGSAGVFAHAEIGSNGDPESKMAAFESLVTGSGSAIGVALMKLCFVDVTAGVSADAVFAQYRAMAERIQQRNPGLVLLHATVPLTVGSPADNVVRQRYNSLLRREFAASGRLVDIALAESTTPSGDRVRGRHGGTRYYGLWRGYAADDGHLNARGSRRVAAALVERIARAS